MLTEVGQQVFAVKVNGVIIIPNIPSRALAESAVFQLPAAQRALAEIVTQTADGRSLLLG